MSDADGPVQFFRPPNPLKLKVGKGPIDAVKLKRAEAAAADLVTRLPEIIEPEIVALEQLVDGLAVASDQADRIRHITMRAHEVRGLGGSYGYRLMSAVARSLYRFVESATKVDAREADIIRAHVATLRAILAGQKAGDGGEVGLALLAELRRLVASRPVAGKEAHE